MFLIGLLYLILEGAVLADFAWGIGSSKPRHQESKGVQRALTGIQVR
jgi:hypothetical protein